jgi:hypothetical protein
MSDEAGPLADGPPAGSTHPTPAGTHGARAARAGIAAASGGNSGVGMDPDRQDRKAERMRSAVIAAMQRSRALTVEHACRLESRGDRAGAELEWARVRRADEMLALLCSAAGGVSVTGVSDTGRYDDGRG